MQSALLGIWAIAGLYLIPAGGAAAQTFTTLYAFSPFVSSVINGDGADPYAQLILSNGVLYGTTETGGLYGDGTVFAINTDGTGFTNLHSFRFDSLYEGAGPNSRLLLSGNTLYGTTEGGGIFGGGTVFSVHTDGTGFTTLHSFPPDNHDPLGDGSNPNAGLVLSGNTLYGTTTDGGDSTNGVGCVFAINTDGTGFTILHSFTSTQVYNPPASDGGKPFSGLVLSGDWLYGTTTFGGRWGNGTVFALRTDGTYYSDIYDFSTGAHTALDNISNVDGAYPYAGLIVSGNVLYGTANQGGLYGGGSVFGLNLVAGTLSALHSFTEPDPYTGTNSDGAAPYGELTLLGDSLYGTTYEGGVSGYGTVFSVKTDGSGFTVLHSFTSAKHGPNSDGANPWGGLASSGNSLFGTALYGGLRNGTVFSISLASPSPPLLTITPSGTKVILTWPASATGFTLQCTGNLVAPVAWTTVSPGPVVINGMNTVTNPISGAQKLFRLAQ
jgi:uncharacterized repeat protein (TIGR03803 family)